VPSRHVIDDDTPGAELPTQDHPPRDRLAEERPLFSDDIAAILSREETFRPPLPRSFRAA